MLTVGAGSAGESAGGSAASRCVVLHTGHALPGAAELEATEVVRRALRRDRAGGALAGGRDVVGAAALLTVQLAVGVAVRNARRRQPALGTSVLLRRIALPILRVRREPALIPNDSSVRLSQARQRARVLLLHSPAGLAVAANVLSMIEVAEVCHGRARVGLLRESNRVSLDEHGAGSGEWAWASRCRACEGCRGRGRSACRCRSTCHGSRPCRPRSGPTPGCNRRGRCGRRM